MKAIYVRSSNGDMIQLDNLIELESGIALQSYTGITDLYQLLFPQDWQTEKRSDKD
ncbi:hypothetical protein NXW09_28795 [Bacteroides ovatus]|nr:hypothetical protein [Bacteroides ovatus]